MNNFLLLISFLISFLPLMNESIGAFAAPNVNPYYKVQDEGFDPNLDAAYDPANTSPNEQVRQQLLVDFSVTDAELDKLNQAFGFITEAGDYVRGALGRIKLKPSDKQRLIKIANGSITEKEKERIRYDKRLLELLFRLTTPKELGGGGLTHLRVGDLLRFRNDPKSRETEGTDNISAHQHGRAADILEINTTHCTESSLIGGTDDLPPFPVKVAWQGGAPYSPGLNLLGSFDAVARMNALRDILGTLPGQAGYNGDIQGFEDLLQKLQRRVIALEVGLPPSSLDDVVNNDVLETLGRAITNKSLGYPSQALVGQNPEQALRSLATSFFEQSLSLPAGSFQGDTVNDALERLGRYKVALDNNIDPEKLLKGDMSELRQSNYYQEYARSEEAFRLDTQNTSAIIARLKQNDKNAYRRVGALLISDRLRYTPDERNELLTQANQGTVKQLNLARVGELPHFPGSLLPMVAPATHSTKQKGEEYLGNFIKQIKGDQSFASLPEPIKEEMVTVLSLSQTADRENITNTLINLAGTAKEKPLYRHIGARYMEEAFDIPTGSLSSLFTQGSAPDLNQFIMNLGQRTLEVAANARIDSFRRDVQLPHPEDPKKSDIHLGLPQGTSQDFLEKKLSVEELKKRVGEIAFHEAFQALYHNSSVGLASLSKEERYSLLLGNINEAATRAGASWVEEDLGLTPDSFSALFTKAGAEERLVNAGISALSGELFEAFEVNGKDIHDGDTLKRRIGQAKIETTLGLKPGSYRDSIAETRKLNVGRFETVFDHPGVVDTMLALPLGTTKRLLDGAVGLQEVAIQVANTPLTLLDTESLHQKMGWEAGYKLNGKALLKAIATGQAEIEDENGEVKTFSLRELLALVGSFNLDNAFGYHPRFMKQWANANSETERNRIVLKEGGLLYSDRLGIGFERRDDLLASYTGNTHDNESLDDHRQRVNERIHNQLESPLPEVRSASLRQLYRTAQERVAGIELELRRGEDDYTDELDSSGLSPDDKHREQDAYLSAHHRLIALDHRLDDPLPRTQEESIIQSVIQELQSITTLVPQRSATESVRAKLTSLVDELSSGVSRQTTGNRMSLRGAIPESDARSFLNGNMWIASSVLAAAMQAKQTGSTYNTSQLEAFATTDGPIEKNVYQLFRTIMAGSSSDPNYEQTSSANAESRYLGVINDYRLLQDTRLRDQTLERIMSGVLDTNGEFNPNATPYDAQTITGVKSGYFVNEESQDTLFYGSLDAYIRRNDPTLPRDFSKIIMDGSNDQRSSLLYSYLYKKTSLQGTGTFSPSLQQSIQAFLTGYNSETRTFTNTDLQTNTEFMDWASKSISKYTGNVMSSDAMSVAMRYITGAFDPQVATSNTPVLSRTTPPFNPDESVLGYLLFPPPDGGPAIIDTREGPITLNGTTGYYDYRLAILSLSPSYTAEFPGKLLGLPIGEMLRFYEESQKEEARLVAYKEGEVDLATTVFAIDSLLFDGAIGKFLYSVDRSLNLPPGTMQHLVSFLITGNPVDLFNFFSSLFFGTTIECPDMQQEAENNIKKFIREVVRIGENRAEIVPSQIITYKESYLADLKEFIDTNYHQGKDGQNEPCPPGSRCGVFARPEYARHVHIGF